MGRLHERSKTMTIPQAIFGCVAMVCLTLIVLVLIANKRR